MRDLLHRRRPFRLDLADRPRRHGPSDRPLPPRASAGSPTSCLHPAAAAEARTSPGKDYTCPLRAAQRKEGPSAGVQPPVSQSRGWWRQADPATLNLLPDTRLSTSSAAQLIAGIAMILNAYLAASALVRVSQAVPQYRERIVMVRSVT